MFEVYLRHGVADRLRKTLLALSPAVDLISRVPYMIIVEISQGAVDLLLHKRRQPERLIVSALLRIRPPPTSEFNFILCSAPATFALPLSDLIQKLTPAAGDEDDDEVVLTFHRRGFIPKDYIAFRASKPAAGTPASSLIPVKDFETIEWLIPTNDDEFKTIIKIPAEDFKGLIIKLNNFADDGAQITVSVKATRTEVKFSAANEEVILGTQPGANLDAADCIIEAFQDADEVSFSFSLRHRQMIINTCELTESVRLLHSVGLRPMMSCAVAGLGKIMLSFE